MTGYSNFAWYSVLSLFGAVLGFITSCIFLLIYYGMEYTEHVPDSVRFKTSMISTTIIVIVTVVIYFRKEVTGLFKSVSEGKE